MRISVAVTPGVSAARTPWEVMAKAAVVAPASRVRRVMEFIGMFLEGFLEIFLEVFFEAFLENLQEGAGASLLRHAAQGCAA
ncbi:hypothetical protein GCM10019059_06300 [Camelimonas fluminis]|nr:hypothetical protein GCM10019059_06300 [Camelimonas fluminis]